MRTRHLFILVVLVLAYSSAYGQIGNMKGQNSICSYPQRSIDQNAPNSRNSYSATANKSSFDYRNSREETSGVAGNATHYHGVASYQSTITEPFAQDPYSSGYQSDGPRRVREPNNPGNQGSPIGSTWWLLLAAVVYLPIRKFAKNKH